MKLTSMAWLRQTFGLLTVATGLLLLNNADAALREYKARWSGAPYGNTATATANIKIDDEFFNTPIQINESTGIGVIGADNLVISVRVTVEGAFDGNGTFTTADYAGYYLTLSDNLDLGQDWVGQSHGAGDPWGYDTNTSVASGDFRLQANPESPSAPTTQPYDWFMLYTAAGEQMVLTSFAPVLGLADLMVGQTVIGGSNATLISVLYNPATDSDGTLVMHARLKGPKVMLTNDDCILRWNGTTPSILVREGSLLSSNKTFSSFGDPICHETGMYFSAKLRLASPSIVVTNDQVIVRRTSSGQLTQMVRKGFPAAGCSNYVYTVFQWMHPAASGLFFGAQIKSGTLLKHGIWFTDGVTTELLAVSGGTINFQGVDRTIGVITGPLTAAPSNWQTRVGGDDSISVVIKTTDAKVGIRTYRR